VFRLDAKAGGGGVASRWPVDDVPRAISLNRAHNVLVTCGALGRGRIREFTTRGYLLRDVTLPDDLVTPWHAIQSESGRFIVSHGGHASLVHRVCAISSDARRTHHSHGGESGPDTGRFDVPRHLAVDSDASVFVADIVNRRVTLLSPTLEFVRHVVTPLQLRWWPYRLFLDVRRRRLYVTENDFDDGTYKSGRVVVFSV